MNIKRLLPAVLLACAFSAWADGYTDGIEYYKAGQYDNARTILERNLNVPNTDRALSYYYLGQIALLKGDKASAQADFEKGIAANPECAYNYVGQGALALQNGNEKAADDFFKQAMKFNKKNTEVIVDIARAYYKADKVKYAKKVDEYLAKARKESKNAEAAIYILEGDMIFDKMDPALIGDAAAQYNMAIQYDEDSPEGYVKYATAYIGVNPQFSINKLEELLAKKPNSALAQRELAERYYDNKLWTKAAEQYGKYIQNPNHFPEDKARYSVLLYANADYAGSLAVADEILAEKPNDFQMMRIKMLDLAELDRNDEAAATAEKFFALTLNDNEKFNPIDYTTYGNVLDKLERGDEAVAEYKKALAIDPSRADIWKTINSVYSGMKRYQDAAEAFDQYVAVTEKPSLTDYYQLAAQWLLAASSSTDDAVIRTEDADKGLLAIQHVLDAVDAGNANPNSGYYQRLGLLYYVRNGNEADDATAEAFNKMIDELNKDPEAINTKASQYKQAYTILYTYYQDRDKDKAKEFLDKLQSLN